MPLLRFQDDGSIGNALAQLAAGVSAIGDPKMKLQGDYIRQQIDASRANVAKTQLDTRQLADQMAAQRAAGSAYGMAVDAANPRPDFEMQTPNMQGPAMPQPMIQQADTQRNATLGAMKAAGANAFMRGGGPMEAFKAMPFGLAMTQNMMNGAPTDEQSARTMQTQLTGQLPDAGTAFTEGGQRALQQRATENEIAKANRAPMKFTGPNDVFMTRDPAGAPTYYQMPENMRAGGAFTGDSELAQGNRIMEQTAVKIREGTATAQDVDNYDVAWHRLYGPKTQTIDVNGQKTLQTLQDPAPANRPQPGKLREALGLSPALAEQARAAAPVDTAQGAPAGSVSASGGGTTLGYKPPLGSEATSLTGFVSQMDAADRALSEMGANGKLPGVLARMRTDPGMYSSDEKSSMREYGPEVFGSPEAKEFNTHKNAFLDALLRKQSGAVIGTNEYQKVATYTIPNSTDTPKQQAEKAGYRKLLINAYGSGLEGADPKETLVKAIALIEGSQGQPVPAQAPAASAPGPAVSAPGGADKYSDVDAIVGIGGRR